MERAEIIAQVEGEGSIDFSAPPGTQLATLGDGKFKISVPLPERKGTTFEAWLLWCAALFAGLQHLDGAFGLIKAGKSWWHSGLGAAFWLVIALCYLIAFFRRSETIRAFWRGLTGKRA